uniref:(northern house mosquito) hypothetical protein n=1 Tax=Culex pipiens TaxID=7175 RepID=A0A8D8GIP2_CULPI
MAPNVFRGIEPVQGLSNTLHCVRPSVIWCPLAAAADQRFYFHIKPGPTDPRGFAVVRRKKCSSMEIMQSPLARSRPIRLAGTSTRRYERFACHRCQHKKGRR